jgi:hypothetical protein
MKLTKLVVVLSATGFLAAASAFAQDSSANIAGLEFQTPKNGMVKQYEDGRKAKVEWHKQQKDKDALEVSQVITGEHTGTYIVGRFGQRWADMDKPSVPDAADLEQYSKLIAPYVATLTTAYYEVLTKVSNPSSDMSPKYYGIYTFHVKYGKNDDFRSAIARVHEANQKLKVPSYYQWFHLVNGGPGGTYVLVVPHATWASFDDDPAIKPLRDRLTEAFGTQESASVLERLYGSVENTYSEIIQTRPDLSYQPAK